MKGTVKIVTIGGGSSYTPELMEGFIKRYEELPIKEIWLVSMLSRVMEPPLGISKILMFASTVPRAIIRAHSTRVRVLE